MAKEFDMSWVFLKSDHSANLEKWWKGSNEYFIRDTDSGVAAWLADFAGRYEFAHCYADYVGDNLPDNSRYYGAVSYRDIAQALRIFDPRISRENGSDKIIIYESALKRDNAKRLSLNPGKAIRRIFPTMPDHYLEKAVDEFKVKFDSAAYEIKWGETREDFKFAYQYRNYSSMANIRFTDWRKSLANSCMRHSFADQGLGDLNPAEAYASPDFRILMAIHKESGKVSARCVVRVQPFYTHAPIYATNDNACDLLEAALSEFNSKPANSGSHDFNGARLLHIRVGNKILAPYQDVEPGRVDKPDKDDEFLTFKYGGDLGLFNTNGYVTVRQRLCCECGEDCDPDTDYRVHGSWYCESCYCEEFTTCDSCEDSYPSDDLETVYDWDSNNDRAESRCVCQSCRSQHYTRVDAGNQSGEYWADSDVYATHDGDTISARDYYNGNYLTSDHSGDIFESDDMVETVDGETIAQSEAEELGLQELPSGKWGKPDSEELAQGEMDSILRAECTASMEALQAGQYPLLAGLQRESVLDFESIAGIELPAMGGMTRWNIAESVALDQFPEIGKICRDGETWYYFSDGASRYPREYEFPTLAECVAAFQNLKG